MQNSKPIISRDTRSKPLKIWRFPKEGAVILIFATMLISLVSTSYTRVASVPMPASAI